MGLLALQIATHQVVYPKMKNHLAFISSVSFNGSLVTNFET